MSKMQDNRVYAVYDLKNHEQCVGVFDSGKECAQFLGISINQVYANVCRNSVSNKGLKIEVVTY